jgi:hypothetical protein
MINLEDEHIYKDNIYCEVFAGALLRGIIEQDLDIDEVKATLEHWSKEQD